MLWAWTLAIGLAAMFQLPLAMADDYATADEMGLMKGFPPPPENRVDRSSLLKGPGNRWSYLNMRSLYPTAGIANANVSIPVRKSIDGAIEKLKIQKPGAGKVDVDTWLKETYSDSMIVVHGDRIAT